MMLNQLEALFEVSGSHKKRAPGGPKPTASRPVRARARKNGEVSGKVRSTAEEECANIFVNDLIQVALAEDVNVAAEDADCQKVTFYDSDEDNVEDDVFSLADPSDDEEEVESMDLANVFAQRVVQQGIQLDMQIQASEDDADAEDFAEVEDFDEDDATQKGLDDLRAKVGSTLVSAARDGSLGASLAQVRAELQAEEDANIKNEARDTLLRAAKSGSLSSALRAVSKAAAPSLDVEALRLEARDTLLRAARDGSLAAAFEESHEEPEADVELLRQEARDTLLRAAGDGRLAAAFRSVREAQASKSKVAQQASKGHEIEKLRREAAQALVVAAHNGNLAEALKQSRKPEVDVEALRVEARSTMIRAAQDGSLRKALEETRVESLRLEARDRLLAAARDGRLAAALHRKTASEERSLDEIREKAKSALLKTLETGDFQKAMESIRQKREAQAPATESTPFHLCPSVGTWLMAPSFEVQAAPKPQPVEQAVEEKPACIDQTPDRPVSPTRATGRAKRRIIGAVVRIPNESLPVDPQPPATSPTSKRPWVMAGSPAAGLRVKEPPVFHLDDDSGCEGQGRGLTRKTSITAMFEAMGSTQLYRMSTPEDEEVVSRPISSCKRTSGMFKSASTGSVSAMALDLGLTTSPISMDVSSKKERLGTPGMGSRCSSVGALRSLRANKSVKQGGMLPFLNKPNSAIDWSVSHVQSVMSMKTHEWSTMAPSPVL